MSRSDLVNRNSGRSASTAEASPLDEAATEGGVPRRRLHRLWRQVYDNSLSFAASARAASDENLAAFLRTSAAERRSLRRQLGRFLDRTSPASGEASRPVEERVPRQPRRGSTWNIARRALLQLRASLPGGDHAILRRLENEHPELEALYETTLEQVPRGRVRSTLEHHLSSIRSTRKRLAAVRAVVG